MREALKRAAEQRAKPKESIAKQREELEKQLLTQRERAKQKPNDDAEKSPPREE